MLYSNLFLFKLIFDYTYMFGYYTCFLRDCPSFTVSRYGGYVTISYESLANLPAEALLLC